MNVVGLLLPASDSTSCLNVQLQLMSRYCMVVVIGALKLNMLLEHLAENYLNASSDC